MDRRTLMAGMAAMIPATVGAQATPRPPDAPVDVLTAFLQTVIGDGDLHAIGPFLSPALDVDAAYWEFADLQANARRGDGAFTYYLHAAFGDDLEAIAYCEFGSNDWNRQDVMMAVHVRYGKITTYRWLSGATL